jgi:hypothetical protein
MGELYRELYHTHQKGRKIASDLRKSMELVEEGLRLPDRD